jgi:peptidoglycan hydrolase-like protein with peptidoglycan-binding domain
LGYSVAEPTGKMDEKTLGSLRIFARAHSIEYDGGVVTTELLSRLYDAAATPGSKRLVLEAGDCDPQVVQLNQRLKSLGYLAGSVNPSYDEKTVSAIELVKTVNPLAPQTDDLALLDYIYSNEIAGCPEELRPKALGDTVSSTEGQVISDRQLKVIRKWLTKQFAVNHTDKQAVKRLQMRLVRMQYLRIDQVTMIYDQDTFNAIMGFQADKGLPADGIVSKAVLTEIFASEINRTLEPDGAEEEE